MATQNLVVVESAAKAKTIEKFLGRGYIVRACLGHVRDLPKSRLGVDVEHDFQPQYVVPPEKKEIVKRLKNEARQAGTVLLATDPDREGEAIAWHLVSALGLDADKPVRRIEFHEITRGAVTAALKNPRDIDGDRVNAQQARRVLDRLIGYPVSNFLGRKVQRGLSAGRVQSVAVRMVVDREREIEQFTAVEYWSLDANLSKQPASDQRGHFRASLTARDGQKLELHTGAETALVQADLDGASWQVAEVKEREQQRHPAAPFTTSTLQQEASRKLGFTAKRTMVVAQQLYEGVALDRGETTGLITYMRTDSVNVAQSAQEEAREYIRTRLASDLVPEQARTYKTRSKLAQEAHEAIRPTSVFLEPTALKQRLSSEQFRLYELIWRRFVASQMRSAIFDITTVEIDARASRRPAYRFRASGSVLKFRGFLSLYLEGRDDDQVQDEDRQPLPAVSAGESLAFLGLDPEQHFTQPPARYTEATLVKALEEQGIGRPSTYAPTLSTIQDRRYVQRDGKALRPTDLGTRVNDLLVDQFGRIVNLGFTALLEDKLDEVAQGDRAWVPVVDDFYQPLREDLERAEAEVERQKPADIPTDKLCSQGHAMVIKEGRFGRFLACTQYPEHKETQPLEEELPPDAPEERCTHGQLMHLRSGPFGPFYTSTHDCGEKKAYAPRVGVPCPTDAGEIVVKRSKRGRVFYGCANWPACEWVSWNQPLTEPCPECGGLQLDMGHGRVRCLKHEGEPTRFVRKEKSEGASDSATGLRPGTRPKATSRGRRAAGGRRPAGGSGKRAASTKASTAKRKPAARARRAGALPGAEKTAAPGAPVRRQPAAAGV